MHTYSTYPALPEVVTLAGERVTFTEVGTGVTVVLMDVVFESVLVKDGGVGVMSWNMVVDELQLSFRGMTVLPCELYNE